MTNALLINAVIGILVFFAFSGWKAEGWSFRNILNDIRVYGFSWIGLCVVMIFFWWVVAIYVIWIIYRYLTPPDDCSC